MDSAASLRWQGDGSLPRLPAKTVTKYLLQDHDEAYRPDVTRRDILLYATMRPEMDGGQTLRTAGNWLGQSRMGSSYMDFAGSRTTGGFRSSFGGSKGGSGVGKSRSVPSLGIRTLERAPAALQFEPAGARSKQATLHNPGALSPEERKVQEKEQQVLTASKRLWTYANGSELLIKTQLVIFRDEDPKAPNALLLQKLSKAPVLGMQTALKQGAKVDWQNPEWDNATLLLKAVRTDSLPLAMYCLALGADPEARDDSGRGIFHWGALNGSPELMTYLIENYCEDVEVDERDGGGDTPLHLAAYHGQLPTVRLLVRAGADPQLENRGGFSALELAQARRVWHVASYLTSSRDFDDDRGSRDSVPIKELLRPCNLTRATEVRATAEPAKPKAKAKADAKRK